MPKSVSGEGMYSEAQRVGKFHMLKRTEGISTTQIVQRLLVREGEGTNTPPKAAAVERTLATTQRLAQFAAPANVGVVPRSLTDAKRVVYMPGVFDLLHAGHTSVLRQAAQQGDFLLVGLFSDEEVRRHRGEAPILTLLERAMAVLSMNFVDDVLLDAPWEVTEDLLKTINASVVVYARTPGTSDEQLEEKRSRLRVAEKSGKLVELSTSSEITAASLKSRFLSRVDQFKKRNDRLMQKELDYAQNKDYVPEA